MNPSEQPLTIETLARWVNQEWKWMPRRGNWFQRLSFRLAKDLLDAKLKLQMYEGQGGEKEPGFADRVKQKRK